MTTSDELKTRSAVYRRRADGIVVQTVTAGVHQTVAHADENIAAFKQLAGAQKALLLADMRASFSTDNEVRDRYASDDVEQSVTAMAMLVRSTAGRMIGNFFLTLNRPRFPSRAFTDEAEAVAWLLTQRGKP